MGNISGMQVREVIRLYSSNNSILETARAAGLSTVKVRKILITEGLWESDTSIKRNLAGSGTDHRRNSGNFMHVCEKCSGLYAL